MTSSIQVSDTALAERIEAQRDIIKSMFARGASDNEFEVFIELAKRYALDPFARQIWCVRYGGQMQVFVGRDGYLAIAHRSGVFDGMESGIRTEDSELIGWCRVYRTDMSHPFYSEVALSEYRGAGGSLWGSKPRTMLIKVAEAHALRHAFCVSGTYLEDEIDEARRDAHAADPRPAPAEYVVHESAPEAPTAQPTTPAEPIEIYTDMQVARIRERYVSEGYDTAIFSAAKIRNGEYNKAMIEEDFRKQQNARKTATAEAHDDTASDADADEVKKLLIAAGIDTSALNYAKTVSGGWSRKMLDQIRDNATRLINASSPAPSAEVGSDADFDGVHCQFCGVDISKQQGERTVSATGYYLCSKCAATHKERALKKASGAV